LGQFSTGDSVKKSPALTCEYFSQNSTYSHNGNYTHP
jgi:hypothetical protein